MSERYPGGVITKNAIVPTPSSAPGVWTLDQQLQAKQAGIWPYGGPFIYIEDVFSTYLYTGNGSTQTITNGIDLSGKGGLVWNKSRSNAYQHCLTDTARGVGNSLDTSDTAANDYSITRVSAFNADGFTMGGNSRTNTTSATYASWTFRKQPKFFDVVTYTGNGNNAGQTINHNLGSVPGFIICKSTSATGDWAVCARTGTGTYATGLSLNSTAAALYSGSLGDAPTATTFSTAGIFDAASGGTYPNVNGVTYVAYLFAHDAGGFGLTGTDNVISCGSFTTDGVGVANVTLGYEPQWVMWKASSAVGNWVMIDNMRGWSVNNSDDARLRANLSNAENMDSLGNPTATGFYVNGGDPSATHIYIAIRRGPMKTPTSGTSVFYPQAVAQADTVDSTGVPFPPDLVNTFSRDGTNRTIIYDRFTFTDRLRGLGTPSNIYSASGPGLTSSSTDAETTGTGGVYVQLKADSQNITRGPGWNSASNGNWIYYFMRRAPGFFDVVCYTGTGSATTFSHNLGVVPELMIIKRRNDLAGWRVWSTPFGATDALDLNTNSARYNGDVYWGNAGVGGLPSSSIFSVGTNVSTNGAGSTYVAYLFASCPGVSKVGSYTGTGSTLQIDCGFTGGARFVLIKRTDSTGDWYVWDSARGIVAGNDPYLLLNSTAAEVTNTDYVDTYSAGFEISSTAPAAINANGGTFIFLAIA